MSSINPEDNFTPRDDDQQSPAPIPADAGAPLAGGCCTACDALARVCEETLAALARDEQIVIEIRPARPPRRNSAPFGDGQTFDPREIAKLVDAELPASLRWLLTQASGTVADVAHQLETRAVDIDDDAREQLRDDLVVLDDELATLRALLDGAIDWDSDLERLLNGEIPPARTDERPED